MIVIVVGVGCCMNERGVCFVSFIVLISGLLICYSGRSISRVLV